MDEIISEFLSEEIEIIKNIQDMSKEWEDEGLDIFYSIYISTGII